MLPITTTFAAEIPSDGQSKDKMIYYDKRYFKRS